MTAVAALFWLRDRGYKQRMSPVVLAIAGLLGSTLPLPAQDGVGAGKPAVPPQDPVAACAAVAEAWLASDQTSLRELEKVVHALFVDRDAGLKWLSAQLPKALQKPNEPRSKGVITLVTHEVLEFLKREHASEWRFAGQFKPLEVLEPVASEQLFRFLLDTPEWYPHTHRIELVPALRDLQPRAPAGDRQAAVSAIAKNAELEPIALRRALSGLLWQWGDKSCAQQWLNELQAACVEGDAEDRVMAMLELAEFQYSLRDYASSARTHRALQAMAKSAEVPLKPVDYYSAACVLCLSGKQELAFEQLQHCLELHGSRDTDSSHKLSRELFERDPEIAALRADPRFAELLDRVLPKKAGSAAADKR